MDAVWIVVPLGVFAGVLTTVAGIGGGLVMTLVLAAWWDPHAALAVTAPALLLGNGHRLWMLRAHVERRDALRLALPALVGAAVGSVLTAGLDDQVLRWSLLGVTALAVVRELGWIVLPEGRSWLVLGGAVVGLVTATTGGGSLLLAPLMLAAGLRGLAFVAAGALVGTAIHIARLLGYGGTGMLTARELGVAVGLGLAILVGNVAGRHLRPRLGERVCGRITWATLLGGIALALGGLG